MDNRRLVRGRPLRGTFNRLRIFLQVDEITITITTKRNQVVNNKINQTLRHQRNNQKETK